MIDNSDSSHIYDVRGNPLDLGNCEGCYKSIKPPFYQYFHIEPTGENYRSGPITSRDELFRYIGLIERKCLDAYRSDYLPYEVYRRLNFGNKDRVCSQCFSEEKSTSDATELHLIPNSTNLDLDRYISELPDLSCYDDFGIYSSDTRCEISGNYYDMTDKLEVIFAEENAILRKDEQEFLNKFKNNLIKDKGRHYPDDKELSQWFSEQMGGGNTRHCKIFDMRGLNYFQDDLVRRFVIILHLDEAEFGIQLWDPRLWWQFWIPDGTLKIL